MHFKELNKGRVVYTNIIDIKIPGVISVSSSVHQPFDWRDLPNGCVLVWDEAHEHPAFSEQDLLKDFTIDESSYDERMLAVDARTDITPALKRKSWRTSIGNVNKPLSVKGRNKRYWSRSLTTWSFRY